MRTDVLLDKTRLPNSEPYQVKEEYTYANSRYFFSCCLLTLFPLKPPLCILVYISWINLGIFLTPLGSSTSEMAPSTRPATPTTIQLGQFSSSSIL